MQGYFGGNESRMEHSLDNHNGHWPVGGRSAPRDALPWMLLGSAQDNAHRALRLYVSDDRLELLQAAVALGAAIEHTVKARLAVLEPALLAERGHVDAVLWLTGHKALAKHPASKIRTISATEAAQICRERVSGVYCPQADVEAAMSVRNAAIHMALVDEEDLRSNITGMVRIIDSLLSSMSQEREKFWGQYRSFAEALITEQIEGAAAVVRAKLSAARARLVELTRSFDDQTKALVIASRSRRWQASSWREENEYESVVECPACQNEAALHATTYWRDDGLDHDGRRWVSKWGEPHSILCPVCELYLEGYDELMAVGEADEFELGEHRQEEEVERDALDGFARF